MELEPNREISIVSNQPSLVYVVTSSVGVPFLRGQLGYLREAGFEVTVISSPGEELAITAESEGVRAVPLPMMREVSLVRDLVSLCHLWRVMRRLRPCITNVGTPKAGLLGGLAALLAGVPCRLYTLHGLRLETTAGMRRQVLLVTERLACLCAHRVICVSESLRQKAITLGLVHPEQTLVLGFGSCNGVDGSRFAPDGTSHPRALDLRQKLGIPLAAPVIGFVGRFTRDKGITELLEAFALLRSRFPQLRLLLVGDIEEGDPPPADVIQRIERDPNIVCPGFVANTAPYYHIMDILALPTHREGFPNVVLEAYVSGKPAVATDATGAVDTVIEGVTGLVVPVGNSAALADALAKLLENPSLARAMGQAGQKHALCEFQPEIIWSGLLGEYQRMLKARGLPFPAVPAQASATVRTTQIEVVPRGVASSSDR